MTGGNQIRLAVGVLTALLLLAVPAHAKPRVAGSFKVSGVGSDNGVARGPGGTMWVTLDNGNDIARITPKGKVKEFNPSDLNFPVGITRGPDGKLWVTQNGGVARIPPKKPNNAQFFPIAAIGDPRGITKGPDGNLWAASGDSLVRIPPDNPAGFTDFTIGGMGARGITASGGRLWIADFNGGRIVRATTAGVPSFFDVGGGPQQVGGGPKKQIAYSNPGTDPQTVGRIVGGDAKTRNTPQADPFGITRAADGAYWFAEFATNRLGRMTTGGKITRRLGGFPANSGPRQIARGAKGTLWVTLDNKDRVARVKGVK